MIHLTKKGIIKETDYGIEHEKYEKKEVFSIFPYLNEKVEIEDDFTLEDFFKIIEKEKELFNIVFSSHLGHFPIQNFIDDINRKDFENNEIDFIIISKYIEIFNSMKMYEKHKNDDWGELSWLAQEKPENDQNDIDISYNVCGEIKEKKESYGIGLCSLSKIKDAKIKIDKIIKIYDSNDHSIIKEGEHDGISVYELFGEILWELSFYGPSEEKEKINEDLENAMEDIEESEK